jgi:transcriptional regulator GlxA family with amidase domain
MAYLAQWRLQLGAQLLKSTSRSVAEIAAEVGYESEPSFNRAFKRQFGLPPARFRSQLRAARRSDDDRTPTKRRALVKQR